MKPDRKKGEGKLYKQWVKHGDLSPEAVPQKETPREESPEKEILREAPAGGERKRQDFLKLYILLGVGIIVVCVGIVLIAVQSC